MDETFAVDRDSERGIATVTMYGTSAGNAMGAGVWNDLPAVMSSLDSDSGVRAVVLRGAHGRFSDGLDLRWYLTHYRRLTRKGHDSADVRAVLLAEATRMQAAITSVAGSRLPVVAAVHGACVGAGLDLAAACDIRLAAADAYFSLREVRLGIVADLGSLQRLPRLIGAGHTRELALTGRDVPADEALRIGLVTHVTPTPAALFDHARALATQIAGHPPDAVSGIKTTLDRTLDMPLEAGLHHVAVWNSAFLPSDDLPDRIAAALRAAAPADDHGADAPSPQPPPNGQRAAAHAAKGPQ